MNHAGKSMDYEKTRTQLTHIIDSKDVKLYKGVQNTKSYIQLFLKVTDTSIQHNFLARTVSGN